MISVKELRALGASLPAGTFRRQLGPFALIQRPPSESSSAVLAPTRVADTGTIELGMLSLLFEFENLLVATLPPLKETDALTIGRLPDCDVVLEDSSVSKMHAQLRWSEADRRCTVKDLGSRNGTFLNGATLGDREVTLRDGDILSFGYVQFWFLLTETLYARLRNPPGGMGSHSG
ncbi:FHA domain-containing protein [Hyalangium rubrum]|uniref:FHA domain-containing protein n=1 Tax=Hyalangium rubrum TaxID=3103134 RepID=A0ABU5HDZ3_9BACT|nr:FHA domain-containing protein [Hyalangium sp. s54d21]MDY7231695.1 FHA domain-containing protein [Hyalangium sp. s54d21]